MKQSEFHDLTQSFIGLELTRPWRGHGSALFAEVGLLTHSYERTKRPKSDRGLDFGWSWRVESKRAIVFGSTSNEGPLARGVESLRGMTIEHITLQGRLPELQVQLSGRLWISTFASTASQPDWTVFLPDGSYLTVRRGSIVRESKST